jgi:hypothetical protein
VDRRLVITVVAATAVVGTVVPSFAAGTGTLPVSVQKNTDSGVSVGVYVNGQPGAGATVDRDGRVCVGMSYQIPQCVAIVEPSTRQSLPPVPVTVQHDSNGTTVGAGEVGVHVSPNGRVCPEVSTQTWQCVGGEG